MNYKIESQQDDQISQESFQNSKRERYISESNSQDFSSIDNSISQGNFLFIEYQEFLAQNEQIIHAETQKNYSEIQQVKKEQQKPNKYEKLQINRNSLNLKNLLNLDDKLQNVNTTTKHTKLNSFINYRYNQTKNVLENNSCVDKNDLFPQSVKNATQQYSNLTQFNNSELKDLQYFQSINKKQGNVKEDEIAFLQNQVIKLNKSLKNKDIENLKLRDKVDNKNDVIIKLERKFFKISEQKSSGDKQLTIMNQQLERIIEEKQALLLMQEKLQNILQQKEQVILDLQRNQYENFDVVSKQNQYLMQKIENFQSQLEKNQMVLKEKDKKLENQLQKLQDLNILYNNSQKEIQIVRFENERMKQLTLQNCQQVRQERSITNTNDIRQFQKGSLDKSKELGQSTEFSDEINNEVEKCDIKIQMELSNQQKSGVKYNNRKTPMVIINNFTKKQK